MIKGRILTEAIPLTEVVGLLGSYSDFVKAVVDNIRPRQGNPSRGVDDRETRHRTRGG